MDIGILQCGQPPVEVQARHGGYEKLYPRLLAGRGLEFTAFDVENLNFPDSATERAGWLISGSPHGVYENHPFQDPLDAFIRSAFAARVPVVGICFGHQAIARAMGGQVEKFAGGWAVGRQNYEIDGQGLIYLNAWHRDQVMVPPAGARTFMSNAFCKHAGLRYGDRALSVQPHPEFDAQTLGTLLTSQRAVARVPASQLDTAALQLDAPLDADSIADEIARFFLLDRTPKHGRDAA